MTNIQPKPNPFPHDETDEALIPATNPRHNPRKKPRVRTAKPWQKVDWWEQS